VSYSACATELSTAARQTRAHSQAGWRAAVGNSFSRPPPGVTKSKRSPLTVVAKTSLMRVRHFELLTVRVNKPFLALAVVTGNR